jgi:uncharacterized protein
MDIQKMYCSECGSDNPDNAVFCQKCGIKLIKSDKKTYPPSIFLDLALKGKNNLWRYILGIIIIFTVFYGYSLIIPDDVSNWGSLANYIIQDFVYVLYILAVAFVIKFIHQRSFRSIITWRKNIKWSPILVGFGLYFFLMFLLSFLPNYITNPSSISLNPNLMGFLIFVPLMFILVPLQTTSEELFFRGYILQGTGFWSRKILILSILNGILFVIPHLANPEMANSPIAAVDWFVFGFFMAYITLKSGTLELAIAGHAANNLFIALLANYENSVMTTPSLFITNPESTVAMANDPISILLSFLNILLIPGLFYIIVFKIPQIRRIVKLDSSA